MRTTKVAASIVMTLSAMAVAGPASASSVVNLGRSHLTDARLAGQVAVRGVLTTASGRVVARAPIWLFAWPASWPGKVSPHPGERVPLRLVGTTVSKASGGYTVRITSPAAVSSSASPQGIVNLEVVAASRSGYGSFSFTRLLLSSRRSTGLVRMYGQGSARTVPQVANFHLLTSRASGASTASESPDVCIPSMYLIQTESLEWTKLAVSYARYSGVNVIFTYSQGQNSSIGVGVSPTGDNGSFTASGSYSVSTSSGWGYPKQDGPASVYYKTEVEPGLYGFHVPGGCTPDNDQQVQAIEIAGGTQIDSTSNPSWTGFCVHYVAGSYQYENSSAATTFSVGMTVNEVGFNANAQTGYDTNGQLYYGVPTAQYLCGKDDYPGGAPGQVVGGKPS